MDKTKTMDRNTQRIALVMIGICIALLVCYMVFDNAQSVASTHPGTFILVVGIPVLLIILLEIREMVNRDEEGALDEQERLSRGMPAKQDEKTEWAELKRLIQDVPAKRDQKEDIGEFARDEAAQARAEEIERTLSRGGGTV